MQCYRPLDDENTSHEAGQEMNNWKIASQKQTVISINTNTENHTSLLINKYCNIIIVKKDWSANSYQPKTKPQKQQGQTKQRKTTYRGTTNANSVFGANSYFD